MAAPVTMKEASQQYNGFYVPQFQVHVDGSSLPKGVLHDIVEITYKDKIEEIDSCELVVNNWDADHNCLKYIGAEALNPTNGQPTDTSKPNYDLWNLFDPCTKQVELSLGYANAPLTQMMVGTFVTYEPSFPASGPSVLSVRMLNLMSKLRNTRVTEQYTQDKVKPTLTDSGIAVYIDQKQRLPLPIKVADDYKTSEAPLTYVMQNNQFDIDFLWERARRIGYDLYLKVDTDGQLKLFFMKSTTAPPPVYELKWGQSLIDFKPTLTVGNQFKSVTVQGWDRAAQKPINVKLDLTSDEMKKLNKNVQYLLNQCDPRDEFVVEKAFDNTKDAQAYAKGVFTDQMKRVVKATGTTVGLPLLRAGSRVSIPNLGTRLSGTYFITATTHNFSATGGYTTRFEARMENQE